MAANSLPQGFSVFQPTLGAQLQFFPAVGTRELDELVHAYIQGPASAQEKRASVALDFFEYAHLTGQTFKFYPVYTLATPVESPATASPFQDSGYGSSFNASPIMSNWDWSQVNATTSTRRPSTKAASRQQPSDFSNLPGMKIMTKDGRDVTNSASRGSKTKEQRDHAHLMRIIKACDSCKKKKIRCDPSHKKRGVSSTPAQPAKITKKTKTVAPEPKAAPVVAQEAAVTQLALPEQDFLTDLDSLIASVETGSESWEGFLQYPAVDDNYDYFNDPEGYFSPESSSSLSEYSAKPTTPASTTTTKSPTTQQDVRGCQIVASQENAAMTVPSAQLPFNQPEGIYDYVDFNLYSPETSFSEDDRMVPIEVSKQSVSQPRSPAPNPLPPNESFNGLSSRGGELVGDLFGASFATSYAAPQSLFTDGQLGREDPYRDPGAGLELYSSLTPSSLGRDALSSSMWSHEDSSVYISGLQSSVDAAPATDSNVTISRGTISTRGRIRNPDPRSTETPDGVAQPGSQQLETQRLTALPGSQQLQTHSLNTQPDSCLAEIHSVSQSAEIHNVSQSTETHNVTEDNTSQHSSTSSAIAPVAVGLASIHSRSSMGVLASVAVMLMALAAWSYISEQFANTSRSFGKKSLSVSQSQSTVNRLATNVMGRSDGATSVSRMVSMSRSLIAV
ncbi:hypothetical protein F66182_10364 [Fusarium sp. NRRL 66182]|nr:hypothetical protein F66182_10364 [Fusarium sp. NRRL 66182]